MIVRKEYVKCGKPYCQQRSRGLTTMMITGKMLTITRNLRKNNLTCSSL